MMFLRITVRRSILRLYLHVGGRAACSRGDAREVEDVDRGDKTESCRPDHFRTVALTTVLASLTRGFTRRCWGQRGLQVVTVAHL